MTAPLHPYVSATPSDGACLKNSIIKASTFRWILAALAMATGGASADQSGDFSYVENPTSITITGYPTSASGPVIIPNNIVSKPVTAIGANAFYNCGAITGVTIPATVSSIGNNAFGFCLALASVPLPSGLTSIGSNAFVRCISVTSVTIPPGVTSIGVGAFANCTGLTSVSIPASVTSLPQSVFNTCSGLTSLTIPSGVTSIGVQAFQYCSGLSALTIPGSVTSVGSKAFSNCRGLTGIAIPASVGTIGTEAFASCSALASISVDPGNPNFSSSGGVLFNKTGTSILAFPPALGGGYAIPPGVTSVATKAFFTCGKLIGVTFPTTVTSIGQQAFSTCGALLHANFTGDAPAISFGAFELTAPGFTIHYLDSSQDFTSPTWSPYDYPAAAMGPDNTPVTAWLLSKGLPANSDLQSDTNGDGTNLLMSYALNIDPYQSPDPGLLRPSLTGGQMSLDFYAGSAGITYTVLTCDDLQSWTPAGVSLSAPDANQHRTATVGTAGPQRFMRLAVSR